MIDFKNLLPQFCTKSWVEEYGVTAIEFTEDVAIGFVSKVDSGYSYLLNYMYEDENISLQELLEISHQNLWNKDSEHDIKIAYPPPKNKVIWWLYDDQFNAIRLLIPEFLAYLKGELGNNFF